MKNKLCELIQTFTNNTYNESPADNKDKTIHPISEFTKLGAFLYILFDCQPYISDITAT